VRWGKRHRYGTADDELLEAAKLGHLEECTVDVAVVVQEDIDLAVAFETGDRVDHHSSLLHIAGVCPVRTRTQQVPRFGVAHHSLLSVVAVGVLLRLPIGARRSNDAGRL
jgi:hypothetical protein